MEGGDDDDEGGFGGMYENGHWAWDDSTGQLLFVSDLPQLVVEAMRIPAKAPTGTVEFRDDVDLIEQIRYRRRYQRKLKPGQADVITLQDIKDVAIYTAPVTILSSTLISALHLTTTERFLRALILYSAYYLQIADEMAIRILELDTKIRTPYCDRHEGELRDNLEDLRVLVAKEYSTMLIGGGDTRKYHHMGPQKKRRSLSNKDARFFETLLRMAVQIVWLALGRKSFNQIELEINRVFKSDIFNSAEHILRTGYIGKMEREERSVMFGHCLKHEKKLNTRSPLMNDVFCHRDIDYRLLNIGVTKVPQITSRLHYLLCAVAGPEEEIKEKNVVLGIIGMPRSSFDTMLKPLPTASVEGKSKASMQSGSCYSSKSSTMSRKSQTAAIKLYPDIVLPTKESKGVRLPPLFPTAPEDVLPVNTVQLNRWQNRLKKLLNPGRN